MGSARLAQAAVPVNFIPERKVHYMESDLAVTASVISAVGFAIKEERHRRKPPISLVHSR